MITSKQRAALRALANPVPAIFQIGKGGVTDNLLKQLDEALTARELIKISVLNNCESSARELCGELAEKLFAEPVQTIGSKIVLYRRSERKDVKHIELD